MLQILTRTALGLALLSTAEGLVATPAAFGVGKPGFHQYLSRLPKDFNVVNEGGWYALKQRYESEIGKENFKKFQSTLPSDVNFVAAGGYNNVEKLAADPKSELVSLIVNNLTATGGKIDDKTNPDASGKIDALVALLQARGKGFSSVMVDGQWVPVFSRQGKKSPKIQKLTDKRAKAVKASSDFNVKDRSFDNLNYTPRGNGILKAVVKYNPVAQNFDKDTEGKIVLRRITCDIVDASFKYWKLPKIPLPLRKKGGHLDFLYMDEDIRITRGNRGGLFVHFRPAYLERFV